MLAAPCGKRGVAWGFVGAIRKANESKIPSVAVEIAGALVRKCQGFLKTSVRNLWSPASVVPAGGRRGDRADGDGGLHRHGCDRGGGDRGGQG